MLERLTQYLDSLDESYLLVFFGDHQPNLGGNYLAYRELDPTYGSTDTVADTLQPYTVPYLIWGAMPLTGKTTTFWPRPRC